MKFKLYRSKVFLLAVLISFSNPVFDAVFFILNAKITKGHIVNIITNNTGFKVGSRYSTSSVYTYTPIVEFTFNNQIVQIKASPEPEKLYNHSEKVNIAVKNDLSEIKIISFFGLFYNGYSIIFYLLGLILFFAFLFSIMNSGDFILLEITPKLKWSMVKNRKG